jgi:hypothetical protein
LFVLGRCVVVAIGDREMTEDSKPPPTTQQVRKRADDDFMSKRPSRYGSRHEYELESISNNMSRFSIGWIGALFAIVVGALALWFLIG